MISSLMPPPPPMPPDNSSKPTGDGNLSATTREPFSLMPPPPPPPTPPNNSSKPSSLMPPPSPMPPSQGSTKPTGDVNPAATVNEPSLLMPPPPPMSLIASAGPAGDINLSATIRSAPSSSDGVTSPGSTAGEIPDGSYQVAAEADKKKTEVQGKDCRNDGARAQARFNSGIYSIPSWSAAPAYPFTLEVIKDGALVETLDVSSKGAYMFGRSDQCDFMMEHPSISRFHAVLQFKRTGDAYIHDLGSTHGTIVNKKKVPGKSYVELHVGDLFKFGLSSRLYILQGPAELMPKAGLTKAEKQSLRESQDVSDMADQEASLLRAKRETEGATWGMMEDAIESEIQEEEEITWQNYKGQLTEKQQKTLEKIHKRNEKVSSLKREIDAIQVKEIPQGGLTQGQQTQVARNQQRIEQLMEELDNLEETLNQSIHESMGARGEKVSFKKGLEDEEDDLSDDDEFYDRTSRNRKAKGNGQGSKSGPVVETAVSLLEKREIILKELKRLELLLAAERKADNRTPPEPESQDPLDAFMTTVSSKLESEHVLNLRQDVEKQQADLNRVTHLLKVADPSGEALKSWEKGELSNLSAVAGVKQTGELLPETSSSLKSMQAERKEKASIIENSKAKGASSLAKPPIDKEHPKGKLENTKGPLWLGHARTNVDESKVTSGSLHEITSNEEEFVEYKERHKAIKKTECHTSLSAIPEDACGLIVRKHLDAGEGSPDAKDPDEEKRLWEGAALAAADTVALLLRHQKGLGAFVDEELQEEMPHATTEGGLSRSSKKRKLGPERPDFLKKEEGKFQAWVPPSGQTGDGKTKLNEKYGY